MTLIDLVLAILELLATPLFRLLAELFGLAGYN